MPRKNVDSFNPYNLEVRDYMDMDFNERFRPEPIDLKLANFTLIPKDIPKSQSGNILNNLLKFLKVV